MLIIFLALALESASILGSPVAKTPTTGFTGQRLSELNLIGFFMVFLLKK